MQFFKLEEIVNKIIEYMKNQEIKFKTKIHNYSIIIGKNALNVFLKNLNHYVQMLKILQ